MFAKIRDFSNIIVENPIPDEMQRSWTRFKGLIYLNKLY
jgi:hypothetical protein